MALIVASVPELVILTISMEGKAPQTNSASSTSRSVGAPKVVPFLAAVSMASMTSGYDCPFHQPGRAVHGELRSGVYALSATLQTRQPPSLRLFKVYYPGPVPTVTELTPHGEPAGCPHHYQRRPFRRNPARTTNPPTARKAVPVTAQNICPVMKLPGNMPMPCNNQMPPMRIINPPAISSA